MTENDYIFGIRAVLEAIEAGKQIDKLLIRKGLQGPLADELNATIRRHHIPAQRVPQERLDRINRGNNQGVIASISPVAYHKLSTLVARLYDEGRLPLMVGLDGITDVRNFGAIARTAECVAADAVIIPDRGSAGVGPDAVKTSAGALLTLPVCREHSMTAALRYLRDNGYSVVAATEKTDIPYTEVDYTGPTAIVMGAEDTGISPQLLELCDQKGAIPMFGTIGSLNVSVAAGVVLYEAVRQRLAMANAPR